MILERKIVNAIIRFGLHESFPKVTNFFAKKRMDPYFFIIGFQKAGTTSIYNQLMDLPIFVKGIGKEIAELAKVNPNKDYFKLFFPKKKNNYKTGNASHLDIYSPYGVMNIKKHFPNSKIIVILRNPTERAYSHFLMDKKFGWIGKNVSFEDYIDFEIKILENVDITSIYDLYSNTKWLNLPFGMTVGKGIYVSYIKFLLEKQVDFHLVCLEKYKMDFEFEFQKILSYLELDNLSSSTMKMIHSNQSFSKEPMSKKAKEKLDSFYLNYNQELFSLIGDKFPWF